MIGNGFLLGFGFYCAKLIYDILYTVLAYVTDTNEDEDEE